MKLDFVQKSLATPHVREMLSHREPGLSLFSHWEFSKWDIYDDIFRQSNLTIFMQNENERTLFLSS